MNDKPNDALRTLSSELAGLKTAGTGHSAKALASPVTIDCGTFSPEAPQTPATNPNEAKILRFIKLCRVTDGLTPREISSGTQISLADIREALASMVTDGTLTVQGDDSNFGNHQRYNLPLAAQEPLPVPEPYESADQRVNRLAQPERDRIKREHPALQSSPIYRPSDEEISAALLAQEAARKNINFTPAEKEELRRMANRLPGLNPQVFLPREKK